MEGGVHDAGPHPFLDLSPMEQVVLLRAERYELRTSVVRLEEGEAIRHLRELGLIELQDAAWVPTRPAGSLVAYLLERLELVRKTRRGKSAPEKKAVIERDVSETVRDLRAQIRALPVP